MVTVTVISYGRSVKSIWLNQLVVVDISNRITRHRFSVGSALVYMRSQGFE